MQSRRDPVFEGATVRFDVSTPTHPDTWATVDADVWPLISRSRWAATKRANGLYVRGTHDGKDVLLHRVVTSAPDNLVVDHIDGRPLNNCRTNLRVCTLGENAAFGNDRRRGYYAVIELVEKPTREHAVKRTLADGTVKEYCYPTRSVSGTKLVRSVKKLPPR